jgi:hypothetical protein
VIDLGGTAGRLCLSIAAGHLLTSRYEVHQAWSLTNPPSPSYVSDLGSTTTIRLLSRLNGPYELKVYDVAGRLIRRWQGDLTPREFRWNGRDQGGRVVASGVYYYELSTSEGVESRRMVLRR